MIPPLRSQRRPAPPELRPLAFDAEAMLRFDERARVAIAAGREAAELTCKKCGEPLGVFADSAGAFSGKCERVSRAIGGTVSVGNCAPDVRHARHSFKVNCPACGALRIVGIA